MKRRKEAEFLVLGDIPVAAIIGFIVYNEMAYDALSNMGVKMNDIHINKTAYF